jgi:PAS domain S-box-containing protein
MNKQDLYLGYAIIENHVVKTFTNGLDKLLTQYNDALLTIVEENRTYPLHTTLTKEITINVDQLDENQLLVVFHNLKLWEKTMETNRDLESIFNYSHDGIYVTDGKGDTLKVNPGSERNFGLSSDQLIGQNVVDLENQGVFKPSVVQKVLKEQKRITLYQETRAGKVTMATGNPIFDDDGRIIRVICNSMDITELTLLKERLKWNEEMVQRYETELLELRQKDTKIDGFIVNSEKMKNVLNLITKVATVDSNVILTGESGTGKDVVARAIHTYSNRNKKPFIKVNCGAIPDNLLESELFGYDSGAFTGAKKGGKPGYFELADKGTLFLDEIGELPFSLQAKLLQAIQEKVIQRVGGTCSIKVDFRLVAATNRDLAEMVKKGEFREDLYYRLNVIPVQLPPLRDRKEEIPFLIKYFLNKFNSQYNMEKTIKTNALTMLLNYHWPGNVRQLQNVMERLIILSDGSTISPEDILYILGDQFNMNHLLTQEASMSEDLIGQLTSFSEEEEGDGYDLKKELKQIEKKLIKDAINKCKTTRKTADFLGLSQSTLVRRVKELQIEED